MNIAIYIFLLISIINCSNRIYDVGTDPKIFESDRGLILIWYIGCIIFAAALFMALLLR